MQLSAILPPFFLPVDPDGHFDADKMVNLFSALVDYFAPILYVLLHLGSDNTAYTDQYRAV